MVKTPLAIEHALLGLLRRQPMHAYEMHQYLLQADALGLVWRVKQSRLYALLTRFEEIGYIRGTTEPQGARPPRKVLHLTDAGRAAFERWVVAPVAHGRDFRIEFMAKLFFAQQSGPKAVTALIERQREACRHLLADLRNQASDSAEQTYNWLVIQFRIGQIEAIMRWLDTCDEKVKGNR
jgi:DNA-binding PadR family transcriptional regulator